jgi:hypothetical protein
MGWAGICSDPHLRSIERFIVKSAVFRAPFFVNPFATNALTIARFQDLRLSAISLPPRAFAFNPSLALIEYIPIQIDFWLERK